jgi:DNA repair protein RecN (Recombination protein N)
LAVIEDLTIELGEGLNCFTGRTGAGKSLIIGAFEILLGLRSGGDMIRPGAQEARVTGVFDLHDAGITEKVAALIDQPDMAPGEPLLMTRKLYASGRSGVSINGQPVAAAIARQVGELLVDIHGQHDHQFLLKPSNQLDILDEFSRALEPRRLYQQAYQSVRDMVQARASLAASVELRRQQRELYEFQAGEIDDAKLAVGEFEELRQRHALLSNVEKIKREAGQAHQALYEAEGSVLERLQMIAHVLGNLTELDSRLVEIAEQVKTGTSLLHDASFELGRHVDRLELDPAELQEIDERLNVINRLVSKYTGQRVYALMADTDPGIDPVAQVLAYREKIGTILDDLNGQEQDQSQMQARIDEAARQVRTLGGQISELRNAGAKKLEPLIEAQLKDLGMTEARLTVEFIPATETLETAPGAPTITAGASGLESIEILVSTNPGQPARPLRKIASGGELSRIMLAIKSILAQTDRVSVLVFDEIDSNIGGRMGTVIGTKLRALAWPESQSEAGSAPGAEAANQTRPRKGKKAEPASVPAAVSARGHQVLCITHLPQIAAFADRHFRIEKSVQGQGDSRTTATTVARLAGEPRIEELAEMLAGRNITDTTRAQVRELIASAGREV